MNTVQKMHKPPQPPGKPLLERGPFSLNVSFQDVAIFVVDRAGELVTAFHSPQSDCVCDAVDLVRLLNEKAVQS